MLLEVFWISAVSRCPSYNRIPARALHNVTHSACPFSSPLQEHVRRRSLRVYGHLDRPTVSVRQIFSRCAASVLLRNVWAVPILRRDLEACARLICWTQVGQGGCRAVIRAVAEDILTKKQMIRRCAPSLVCTEII